MAIAIRGGTPLTVITTSNPISGTLTGTRQPQAGDLLLIIHGNDFYALSNMPTPTVGGSTTGVGAVSGGSADAGTNHAHIKSYTFAVGSTGDLTVSVTETGSGDEDKSLVVYVLSGADTSTPTDGAAGNFNISATTTHDAPSVSPGSSDAFLVCHDNSGGGSSASSYTPPSGMTEQYDAQVGGISHTGATLQLSASGATGTKTFTPSGSVEYATISVAIRTASGAAAPAFVAQPGRRRTSPAPARPRTRVSTPVRAQVNPPVVFAFVDPARRLRGLLPRRGRVVNPIAAQASAVPSSPTRPVRERLKGLRLFRPDVVVPVPTQVVVAAPAYPPRPVRSRLKGLRLFRPDVVTPVPAQVVVTPPAYPPQNVRTRLRGLRLFRGHAATPVPAQVVVTPGVYVLQTYRARLKPPTFRRHDNSQPYTDQPPPAQLDPRPRPRFRPVRSHIVTPPPPQAPVPLFARVRLRLAKVFRGEIRMAAPPQIIVVPPARVAQATRARRNQFAARRRYGGVEGWMVPGVHSCTTTRPNTGTTGHVSGITARPDTGITEDPC